MDFANALSAKVCYIVYGGNGCNKKAGFSMFTDKKSKVKESKRRRKVRVAFITF